MQDQFRIVEQKIIPEERKLHFKGEGKISRGIINDKFRIVIVFQCGRKQRRFPVDSICFSDGEETFFCVDIDIQLENIFYQFDLVDAKKEVQLFFEYCNTFGEWHVLPNKMAINGSFFLKHSEKKSVLFEICRRIGYVICTLFLPLIMLDGLFVIKGYKKSQYINKEIRGKKAIFYHAHGIVKELTGFGYSPREIKTNYFKKIYKRYRKRIKETKGVLLLSERLCEPGGNLDIIRERLRESGIAYEEVLDTRPINKLPFSVIRRAAKRAAGAKIIILEDFYPQIHSVNLRSDTELVQLWHACGAFKMFGLSEIGKNDNLLQNTMNHRNYTKAIVSSEQMIPFWSEAYGISPDNVRAIGIPRTDIFFDKSYKKSIKQKMYEKYEILRGKKVVLFAPTFRGSGNKTAYYPTERFSVNAFIKEMPEDTVLIIKNHPFVKDKFVFDSSNADRVLDLTGRENINDILFITNILITDYSSSIFEASLLGIPMIFYVFDLEEYIYERDFYFDLTYFAPGDKVRTFIDLQKETLNILKYGKIEDEKKQNEFKEYFMGALDGKSTDRVFGMIRDYL